MSDPDHPITWRNLHDAVRAYETTYGMDSAAFYARWLSDAEGFDTFDFNHWAALVRLLADDDEGRNSTD